ncbi:hypothetical protein TRFO_41544 [Tritrichomonas foetus]|uniref:Uncharacterized protein n=1 Tax=Tritrichomonas foetus TaxID=1144522 RepID=A0A1J4L4D1_9EUKA|nr:hypothetical protein TRFO_41544 [Tritrichomonas foetus]|eukprot:OHT16789.1 hypothetical protein TRFO_41544 [Tritrichomonas foetus]
MTEEPKKQETLITDVPDAQPTIPEPASTDATGRQSSKSKKGGKASKKKLTKKEIARRKREKAEQERLEQLRIEKELEEKRIHEQEQEMERREQERLKQEDSDLKSLHQLRASQSHQIREEKAKREEWERYVSCNHSTDPNNQSDVNTFISQWRESETTDINALFSKIDESTKLLDQLLNLRSTASVALEVDEFERLSNNIRDIRQIIENKITSLTQHHLLFSDRYALAKNEVLLAADAGGYSYGLWVNLTKNPRIKEIEFPKVTIEICKYIALASLAIRCTMSPFLAEFDKYLLLSPILACEFFQLPSPPKKIGTMMTLRQFSTSGQLISIPYPLRNVNNPQPPLVFKMKFNPDNLPDDTDSVTVIKIDDIQNTEKLVTDVEIDKENSIVKFSCQTNGLFALSLPKYAHFPFQFWEINSTKPDSVEIFIRTAITELVINVDKDGLVSMDSPISFNRLTAPAALEKLQRHGINVIAPASNSELGEIAHKLSGKTSELEDVLTGGISDCATGFRVRSSKWNSQVQEDRAILIAREIVEFGEQISEDEQINNEEEEEQNENHNNEEEEKKENRKKSVTTNTKWKCILAKAKHINLIPYSENSDEPDMKMVQGSAFHQLLLPMLMDIASDAVQGRVRNSSSFISETVRYLLQKMKLFSSTI